MRKLSSESWVTVIVALAILNFFVFGAFIALVIYMVPPAGPPAIPVLPIVTPSPTLGGPASETPGPSDTPSFTPGIVPTFTPAPTSTTARPTETTFPEVQTVTPSPHVGATPTVPPLTPTPSPTSTPTSTASPTVTHSATATPSSTSTSTSTATATHTHTATPSRTPTTLVAATPSFTSTPTSTRTPTRTPTYTHTSTPSPTISHTSTSTASPTGTSTSTSTPCPTPTSTHTSTSTPTPSPTFTSTVTPTPSVLIVTATGTADEFAASIEPPAVSKPGPPSSLRGASVGGDQIDLTWEAPPGAGGSIYRVYWDQGSGYRAYALRTSVRDARYADLGLRPSTTYRYFITTFDGQAESSPVGVRVETYSWLRLPLMRLTMSTRDNPTMSATRLPLATPSASSPLPEPQEAILGLMGTNDYVDDLGNLHLVGEVHNDMLYNVDELRVHVTFYDDSGDVVETVTGSALLDLLAHGQGSPFVIVWENPGEWKRYSLRATARPTTARPTEGLTLVHSYARLDENGLYHVVGTIRNDGLTTPYYVRVVVSLYDSFGRISNAGFAYARPSRIPPGTAASFDCPFEYYPYLAEFLVQMSEQ